MRGRRGLVLGAMLLAMCHAVDAQAQSCQKDNDCAGDLICNGGQCQTLSGATPPPAAPAGVVGAVGVVGVAAVATPTAVAGTVPVRFEGYPTIVAEQPSGQSCQVPCSMQLVPGSHLITGFGATWTLVVGNQGTVFNVSAGDQGMVAGGVVAAVFGAIGFSTGLTFMLVGSSKSDSSYSTTEDEGTDLGAIGLPLLLGGGALLGTGFGLLAGAEKPAITDAAAPKQAIGTPMVGLAPTRNGVLMGATLQF